MSVLQITCYDFGRHSIAGDRTGNKIDRARTKCLNRSHVVADEQHRSAPAGDSRSSCRGIFSETPRRQPPDLIDDQDFRLEMRRDGEGQPHIHAARIALDRRIEEPLDLGEGDDLVELAADLGARHAEDRAVRRCSRGR